MKHFKIIKSLFFSHRILFSSYAFKQAEIAYQDGGYSRSANYKTAIRSFVNAVGDIYIKDVSQQTLEEYQRFLKLKKIKQNTVSCYNRTLRAIYNRAVEEGLVKDQKPFREVFTGRVKTTKRSLKEEFIIKLKELDLKGNLQLETTRDFFIFSFYAMGMPFIDVAYLQKSQIEDDMLIYDRHKTGNNIRIPLPDEAIHIIRKYNNPESSYVFPILTATKEPAAYQEYCLRINNYNRWLKELARKAGIMTNLSSYTIRHSWASLAYKSQVPLYVISQALGHTKPDTTMIYIRELDDGLMRQENEKVQEMVR